MIGDLVNIFVIFNSLLYAAVILFSSFSYPSILYYEENIHGHKIISSRVLTDGFCISNKESLWWSSHAWCFYLDTFFCLMLFRCKLDGIKHKLPTAITEPVHLNIMAHFGHGMGHFLIGCVFTGVDSTTNGRIGYENILWLPIFWYGFIQAIHTKSSWEEQITLSILISFVQLFVPAQFGFTYVQTILLLHSAVHELYRTREEKDVYYHLKACIVNLPIGIVGWLEAYTCDTLLIHMGGHIWYDCTIPFSIMAYYYISKSLYLERNKRWRFF